MDKNIVPVNILFCNSSPNPLMGCYYINKDNKTKIEVKEIEKHFEVNVEVKLIEDFNSAKKIAELINKILVDENGFMRDIDSISINDKNKQTIIKIKEK